jgi:hypothetical protein
VNVNEIAYKLGLIYVDETLLDVEEQIDVASYLMTEETYNIMEMEIMELSIVGVGYNIYGWNDNSGWNYWSDIENGTNYIQITVHINDYRLVNIEHLSKDLDEASSLMDKWNTIN